MKFLKVYNHRHEIFLTKKLIEARPKAFMAMVDGYILSYIAGMKARYGNFFYCGLQTTGLVAFGQNFAR